MPRKELEYVGGCLRDLRKFPEDVQDVVVFALLEAQDGRKHLDAKPMTG
jgi:phage-related protein